MRLRVEPTLYTIIPETKQHSPRRECCFVSDNLRMVLLWRDSELDSVAQGVARRGNAELSGVEQ